jgi:hypothetical protein
MSIKQIKFKLQAESYSNDPIVIDVKIDGVTVFNDTVPDLGIVVPDTQDPFEEFVFDYDVPNNEFNGINTIDKTFSITTTGGISKIESISANYYFSVINTGTTEEPVLTPVAGTAENYSILNIISQPLWNGQALLDRYNIEYNQGPIQVTGPGEVFIDDGETCVFTMPITLFNNTLPPTPPEDSEGT